MTNTTKRSEDRTMTALLSLVREVWECNPQYRLGQLIANIARKYFGETDSFHITDADMRKALLKELKELDDTWRLKVEEELRHETHP